MTPLLIITNDKIDEKAVLEYVKQLGDADFKIREKATNELFKISAIYIKLLTEELKNSKDLEVQERLKMILEKSEEKLKDLFWEKIQKSNQLKSDKKYDEALQELNEILEIRPNFSEALNLKVSLLSITSNYKEVILILKKQMTDSIEDHIKNEELALSLSKIFIITGKYMDAITLLEKVKIVAPHPELIEDLLYYAYELNQDLEKAEAILLKDVKDNPSNEHYNSTLGWFYIRTEKLDKAKPHLEKGIDDHDVRFTITQFLNIMFLEQYQKGLEKLILQTAKIHLNAKDKTNQSFDNNDYGAINDILYLFYQNYFEKMTNQKLSIDFKSLYNSYGEEDKKKWPIPLVGLYGGEVTIENLIKPLENIDQWKSRQDKCEAYFYLGLLRVCENNNKEAKKYFQLSKDQNVYEYVETTAASFMLQKIK